MKIRFAKYQGTGNDFILIDDRTRLFSATQEEIAKLCHRRMGIGADGLILLRAHPSADFEMIYFNSDGREGSLCGNGGRCITAFAAELGIITTKAQFMAFDGPHEAEVLRANREAGRYQINLKMQDVTSTEPIDGTCFIDTGSPHFVLVKDNIESIDVFKEGSAIRYSESFKKQGTNVDFICKNANGIAMRVYERGVEEETYSSGTGAVACALTAALLGWTKSPCAIETKGGVLMVDYQKEGLLFTNIWLNGPATKSFDGILSINH